MKIGLIARADFTGLGMQTHAFYRHMQPYRTLVVDLSHLNRQTNDLARYPNSKIIKYTPYPDTHMNGGDPYTRDLIDEFLEGLDIVFTCETPYDYYLFTRARDKNIKTVLQYNFELLDHIREPDLPRPDLFMAPSLWRYEDFAAPNKTFLPVPVDRSDFGYQHRSEARTFLHIGGNPAMEDRNGTRAVVEAWRYVKSPAKLLIRTQALFNNPRRDPRIKVVHENVRNHADLYREGDVFVMPRKFGGLCLPLNEALSCGMPTVMSDMPPQNEFLRPELRVPTKHKKDIMAKTMIGVHEVDRKALARKIDELFRNPDLVSDLSKSSGELAETISWDHLKPVYSNVFEALLDGEILERPFKWET